MQVIAHDTMATLADILEQSTILDITDHGGMRMYVVEFDGADVLIFESGGVFWSVYPCGTFDAESGGSVHDHARYSCPVRHATGVQRSNRRRRRR